MTPNEDQLPSTNNSEGGDLANPIHAAILETLASAVIALESGVITYFNEAAEEVTGLSSESVIGKTFAEIFLAMEEAGEFTESVLDAVYEGSLVRQRLVNVTFPSGKQILSVSVTRTKSDSDEDGEGSSLAVVFDDVSEVLELREKELVLAREVEARHAELRDAYVELEEHSKHLADAQSKMRLVRFSGGGAVVVLLVMLVLWAGLGGSRTPELERPGIATASESSRTIVVEPQPLTTVVNVNGRLGPKREFQVTSPMSGKLAQVFVPYGSQVSAGQSLLRLDVTAVQIQQRDAEAIFIKAQERLQEVENWSESVEASRARRSVTKARIDLADSKRRLDETVFLLDRGVIPATEKEAAERDYRSRELDLEAAEQDLSVVLEKSVADGRVSRLELENATARLQELDQILSQADIKAPIDGVVMRPSTASSSGGPQSGLVVGRELTLGEHILTIGDVSGLSVIGQTDEVDVVQIKTGNLVRITGDAFPGTVLNAKVSRVSSEAVIGTDRRSPPYFETVAIVDSLTSNQLESLRIGMSVTMEVVVRQEDEVLLVPVEAVNFIGGETVVNVVDQGGVKQVSVDTGVTTLDSVEITSGIHAGDRIQVLTL